MKRNSSLFQSVRKRAVAFVAAVLAVILGCTLAACGSTDANSKAEGDKSMPQVNVVASINQWGALATIVGGGMANVTSILSNPKVEAHDFEPKPADIAKFDKAQIIIVNGADYDPWAVKAAEKTKAVVLNVAELTNTKDGDNPHLWFSATARKALAKSYYEALAKKLPAPHNDHVKGQYEGWLDREQQLEKRIAKVKELVKDKPYAATESVAKYLADDLGLVDATPQGFANAVTNESEPSPADIKAFQDALKEHKISLLFVNDQEADETTNLIVKAAEESKTPIVHITESKPEKFDSLVLWIDALVTDVAHAYNVHVH